MSYWIPVSESMPEHREPVIASYINDVGKRQVVIGYWIEKWKEVIEAEELNERPAEYFEAIDTWYLCAGWYEQQLNWGEYTSLYIEDGAITHWQPVPKTEDLE